MINLQQRIKAFTELGKQLNNKVANYDKDESFKTILNQAKSQNSWFTIPNQLKALSAIADMLDKNALANWLKAYPKIENRINPKTIGVIMAGNIPAVGFHDLLVVLVSGNKLQSKCSSSDVVLIKLLTDMLIAIEPSSKDRINFTDRIKNVDAVIATGSNNSSRYFEYYFKNIPHVTRKNRNSVAVLTGNETIEELNELGKDIFSYFGLGCRNVSKLMVPEGYAFDTFFESIASYGAEMNDHNKYLNNYDYYRAIYLLEQIPFLTNNFLHIKEDESFASPVSVLHYEVYKSKTELKDRLASSLERIQCIVANEKILGGEAGFGKTQQPTVNDYADGVDTLAFILNLK